MSMLYIGSPNEAYCRQQMSRLKSSLYIVSKCARDSYLLVETASGAISNYISVTLNQTAAVKQH